MGSRSGATTRLPGVPFDALPTSKVLVSLAFLGGNPDPKEAARYRAQLGGFITDDTYRALLGLWKPLLWTLLRSQTIRRVGSGSRACDLRLDQVHQLLDGIQAVSKDAFGRSSEPVGRPEEVDVTRALGLADVEGRGATAHPATQQPSRAQRRR